MRVCQCLDLQLKRKNTRTWKFSCRVFAWSPKQPHTHKLACNGYNFHNCCCTCTLKCVTSGLYGLCFFLHFFFCYPAVGQSSQQANESMDIYVWRDEQPDRQTDGWSDKRVWQIFHNYEWKCEYTCGWFSLRNQHYLNLNFVSKLARADMDEH